MRVSGGRRGGEGAGVGAWERGSVPQEGQEATGGLRRPQENLGDPRRRQEAPGGPRRPQEVMRMVQGCRKEAAREERRDRRRGERGEEEEEDGGMRDGEREGDDERGIDGVRKEGRGWQKRSMDV